jgi:fermentation-respiration switch protein FrsA (DUF1100 family)
MLNLINQFVYRPDATYAPDGFTPADLNLTYEDLTIPTADGITISAWYLPAAEPHHALLYCHGNAGDIRDWVHAAPPFVDAGCSLLLLDYRGYGRSEGSPSEEGLYLDGAAAWRWIQDRASAEGIPASILGKSLGSAVGIHLAARQQPASLILDSAFTSMREVVARVASSSFPILPNFSIPKLYESLEEVPGIACPTLVIHGGQDDLVPLEQGERIFQTLRGSKALKVIKSAGHNDISIFPEYHRSIVAFLADPTGFIAQKANI